MRVFILCSGRSGSSAFIEACQYITNYTASHESRVREVGEERFGYPDDHIEADNRLSWFLGEMDSKFGDRPYYVHLKRDRDKVARSYMKRYYQPESIIDAFSGGIGMKPPAAQDRKTLLQLCYDYVDTVHANIDLFLKDKTHVLDIQLESIEEDFVRFWEWIGAEGDLQKALDEFRVRHNASARRNPNFLKRFKLIFLRESRNIIWWLRSLFSRSSSR